MPERAHLLGLWLDDLLQVQARTEDFLAARCQDYSVDLWASAFAERARGGGQRVSATSRPATALRARRASREMRSPHLRIRFQLLDLVGQLVNERFAQRIDGPVVHAQSGDLVLGGFLYDQCRPAPPPPTVSKLHGGDANH